MLVKENPSYLTVHKMFQSSKVSAKMHQKIWCSKDLMGHNRFSALYKRDYCEFLFGFLHTECPLKRISIPLSFNPVYTEWTPPHYIQEDSNFNFRYVRLCNLDIPRQKMVELSANSGDPDQMPHSAAPDQMLHSAASDLGLHCLPVTF